MLLNSKTIARMIDLSCVQTKCCEDDIKEMVDTAIQYGIGHVTTLQSFLPYTKELIEFHPGIHLVGNVSFPSGSDSTSLKVLQAKEMVELQCDEIDMVINVGMLRSGADDEVEADIHAVVETAKPTPVKVIIEVSYLTEPEIIRACKLVIKAGGSFVKTGTGWGPRGTTIEDVRLIKSIVGDQVQIKASGGIRDLDTLVEMYRQGARRFGVNLKSGKEILDYCIETNFTL